MCCALTGLAGSLVEEREHAKSAATEIVVHCDFTATVRFYLQISGLEALQILSAAPMS